MSTKISEGENKIPDMNGLVTAAALNLKISEVENKITDVSGLVLEPEIKIRHWYKILNYFWL